MKRYFIPLFWVFVLVLATAATTYRFEISKNMEIYSDIFRELNTYYVDDVEPSTVMRKGIDAMLSSLDPYTNYISEAEMEDYRFQTTGKYGGIGSIIQNMDSFIVISQPYQDYPADKAGLKAGDKLISVDGIAIKGKSTSDVSNLLKGEPGTKVTVGFLRPQKDGSEKELTTEITRQEVEISSVPYFGMVDDRVGYINLTSFTPNCGKKVQDALNSLKNENPAMDGIVLDLRGNTGGLLEEAVNVCNTFIKKGELVVMTKGKNPEWDREFKTLNQPVDTAIRLAVLTNRRSASASEIVAGTIQDLDRGVVIGKRTFGKGLVQVTRPLSYNSSLKVTTAKYYIPSGRCIQAIDYAERDENGAVAKIPDSLKVEFETRGGRLVYDGGGVNPDIEVEQEALSNVTISLLRKNLLFKYATHFAVNNKEIAQPKQFKLSDNDFEDFVEWVSDKDYDYTTESEEVIEELRSKAIEEGYISAIEEDLKILEEKMLHDKEKDLRKAKEEIKELLINEIAGRYHYKTGALVASFSYDRDLKKAIEILSSKTVFDRILTNQ